MADQRQPIARERVRQVAHVEQVVHEVVVPAGADALRLAMPAQIGREDVEARLGQARRDAVERPGEIEEAVQAEHGRAPTAVPLQQVVTQAVRDDGARGGFHATAAYNGLDNAPRAVM